MAIKRRLSIPTGDEAEVVEPKGLVIVARDKVPTPEPSMTGQYDTPAELRRVGPLSLDCGYPMADAPFNIGDRVKLLRTPYDVRNPQEIRARNRIKNRATAITAMCITCVGQRKLVVECAATECPLWAFRLGGDPFRGQKK